MSALHFVSFGFYRNYCCHNYVGTQESCIYDLVNKLFHGNNLPNRTTPLERITKRPRREAPQWVNKNRAKRRPKKALKVKGKMPLSKKKKEKVRKKRAQRALKRLKIEMYQTKM